jgi:glycine/D-amino acid oxidase-like deaminating enzyme
MNIRGAGAVIDITKRRRGGSLQSAQGRWTAMTTPPGHEPTQPPITLEQHALQLWAEGIERTFREVRLTLTDDDTAAAYLRTLQVLERTLEGSHETGLIDREQLDELLGVLRGLKEVPRLV